MADFRPNLAGIEAVLKLPALEADLRRRAQKGADAAGDGYIAVSEIGRHRARAAVVAASTYARRDNAQDHTLLKIIDDMRD